MPTPETQVAITERHQRLQIVSRERVRDELTKLLLGQEPARGLWLAVNTGLADEFLPELPALALEQDPVHRHKDVLRHTIAVVERAAAFDADNPDLTLRMAALLHDIGKPRTRRVDAEGVSFHLHEVVGAKLAEKRLTELRYPSDFIADVRQLVLLHLRFHTYRLGWSDSAVRRYARRRAAAGPAQLPGPLRLHHPQRVQGQRLAGFSTSWRSGSPGWRPRRSWPASGRRWTAARYERSGSRPARWSARPWPTCWSCALTAAPCPRRKPPRPSEPGRPSMGGSSHPRLTRRPGRGATRRPGSAGPEREGSPRTDRVVAAVHPSYSRTTTPRRGPGAAAAGRRPRRWGGRGRW